VSVEDRRSCMELVKEANGSGAERGACCQVLEVSLRTLERWEKEPEKGDQRREPHSVCAHALTEQEKQAIVESAIAAPIVICRPGRSWLS
jgi:hypothetical protein